MPPRAARRIESQPPYGPEQSHGVQIGRRIQQILLVTSIKEIKKHVISGTEIKKPIGRNRTFVLRIS